jgi:hypothetical protein
MRTELGKFDGQRKRFRARVEEFGTGHSSSRKETILLVEVRCTDDLDAVVADHIWLKKSASFRGVSIGDVIEFYAEVEQYEKGYTNFRQGINETTVDYRLSKPSNVQVVGEGRG